MPDHYTRWAMNSESPRAKLYPDSGSQFGSNGWWTTPDYRLHCWFLSYGV